MLEARSEAQRLKHLWVDAAYQAAVSRIEAELGWTVEVVGKLADSIGFAVRLRRWVVERTLAWLGKYRRLSKDCEEQCETSQSWIYAAMSHILVRRLARA